MTTRLDLLLVRAHPDLSRRQARSAIEKGQVSVDGRLAYEPGLACDDSARVEWDANRKAVRRARLALPRLYEDESLVVVDKPAGLLSVPSGPGLTHEDTALARVREYAMHLHPRQPYAGAVHRLDRGTSGALAFALDARTHAALRDLFRAHRIERRYLALVEGRPPATEGLIDAPVHEAYVSGRRRLARPGEPGRPARSHWRVVEAFEGAALLEVELETGRQHQIRLHLAHLGLPILGEPAYRPAELPQRLRLPVPRPMLHARLLAFVHPLSGVKVRAESPRPEDFELVLARLRRRRPR